MPYTPPAQRSPVASQANTPPRKLSCSAQTATETQQNDSIRHEFRPSLPRSNSSQSYLHKHRRSPSLPKQTDPPTRQATSERETPAFRALNGNAEKGSTTFKLTLPGEAEAKGKIGGTDTPPSSQSSGDEASHSNVRGRRMNHLEELHAAMRGIEQNRQGSPSSPEAKKENQMAQDFSKSYLEAAAQINRSEGGLSPRLPLSDSARKISHSRSSTDTTTYFDFPKNKFDSARGGGSDEDDEDDDLEMKPSLIRKKSGELVRPALKGRRRPSSMPGTPTYSKGVHFQEQSLEHVRTFLQVDRPIAVSAGSSPVDGLDDDGEFPFGESEGAKSPIYDWDIRLTNFPRDTFQRQTLPARTEKVYLSPDTKTLCGNVAVRNLSFHKVVIVRFTLDYWKTTSEVVAEYNRGVRRKQASDGCDRFTFEIKLDAHANLETKTMYFCVRYQVGGQEYWDNNDSMNYQVDFSKSYKNQNGKQGVQPASSRPLNGLPRSKPSQPRPRSMPSFDDFGSHAAPFDFSTFPQPNAMVGESSIRFKNRPSSKDMPPNSPGTKLKNPANQQAFGSRYDFGASISAAIQASTPKAPSPRHELSCFTTAAPPIPSQDEKTGGGSPSANMPKPITLISDKPSLQSPSYHELLDKYCFYGSGKAAPTRPRESNELKAQPTQTNGTDGSMTPPSDRSSISNKATGSVSPSLPPSPSLSSEKKPSYASTKPSNQRTSRSASPATGAAITSRSHSPKFGYPYHQGMQSNFFESHPPTAIQG